MRVEIYLLATNYIGFAEKLSQGFWAHLYQKQSFKQPSNVTGVVSAYLITGMHANDGQLLQRLLRQGRPLALRGDGTGRPRAIRHGTVDDGTCTHNASCASIIMPSAYDWDSLIFLQHIR